MGNSGIGDIIEVAKMGEMGVILKLSLSFLKILYKIGLEKFSTFLVMITCLVKLQRDYDHIWAYHIISYLPLNVKTIDTSS